MKRITLILIGFFLSNAAVAGNAKGQVSSIVVTNHSAAVLFTLSSPINDTPQCNESQRFSITLLKPGGMAAYMAILEAKRQEYEVSVEGLNTCVNEWKSEDIKNIVLK